MNVIWIALMALLGGIVAALLGWLEANEPFVAKKFISSVVRALLAAVVFAVSYNFMNELSTLDLLVAFLGGAGVDVLGKRIQATIRAKRG